MSRRIELADDPDLSGWTELTEVRRETLRCGGIANKTEVGASGGFDWIDEAGSRSLPGRRPIRIIETATTPDTTLFYGRVSTKSLARGLRGATGDHKQFGVGLDDRNQDLQGIVVDGWARPAEKDVARVNALIVTYLSGSSSTSPRARASTDLANTYVAATPTIDLPAETYNDSSPGRVLQDIVAMTGKECFVTVDGEVFYDAPTSTVYASSYSITDEFPNGVDELLPIWDGDAATEDPSELLSGARAKYGVNGAVLTESRSAVEDAFDKWEDTVFLQTSNADRAALELDTLLDNQGVEEKSRRCAVLVPEDQVDRIKWGQTISFRAAAAGDLTPVTLRISYLLWDVPQAPGAPYVAHLELSKPKKIAARIKRGTNPAVIPGAQAPVYDPTACPANTLAHRSGPGLYASGLFDDTTLPFTSVGGNVIETDEWGVIFVSAGDPGNVGIVTPAGWLSHPASGSAAGNGVLYCFYRQGTGADESVIITADTTCAVLIESYIVSSADELFGFGSDQGSGTTVLMGPVNSVPGRHLLMLGNAIGVQSVGGSPVTAPDAQTDGFGSGPGIGAAPLVPFVGHLIDDWPGGYQAAAQIGGTTSISLTDYTAASIAFTAGECSVPITGTVVIDEVAGVGDGSQTTFPTDFEYVPGSLRPRVDGVPVNIDVDSTDPTGRTFTLDFAPEGAGNGAPAETLEVDYVIA